MKQNAFLKMTSLVLTLAMLLLALPVTVFADWNNVVYSGDTFGTNGYYNVISKKDYVLVPGAATETEMVLNNSAGTRRQVLHIVEIDPSNPDVSIVPGYYGIDKDTTDVNNQQAAKLTDMAAYYEDVLGYNIVAGMNTDLYYAANAPRVLVYNGQDLRSGRSTSSVLCVYKDADGNVSCVVKAYNANTMTAELQSGTLLHAVGVSFAMTVNNGVLVNKTEERTSSSAARSMVGVKEDGTLVLVMNDGRGANNSVGFCSYELGECMLSLGCKWAANCDGGGSSTFVSKRAGESEFVMRSVPCDGAERPTIHGIFIVSNVAPTGVLGSVDIQSDYDYFAPGVSYAFGAEAIDTHGYSMNMPADASWALSDGSFGTITDGVFVSNGTVGDVDIQVISDNKVFGTKTVHVADPTTLVLSATETTLPYSTDDKTRTTTIPIVAKIGENDVYTSGAYAISMDPPNGGVIDGLNFTATKDTSIANVTITVTYIPTQQQFTFTVNYGKGSEILWDFEDGNISAWVGTDEADRYLREHGVELTYKGSFSTPFGTLFNGGQISWSNKTTVALSSVAEGGKAHSGDKSLAVTFNMKNVEFNSWVYSIIWNIEGNTVLRDVENGKNATAVGCWVYVPEGFYTQKNNGAQSLQLQALKGTSSSATLSGLQLNMQYNGKNLNALTEADIPENRWIYVSADLTANNFVKLCDPLVDVYRSPSIIRMYVKPSEAQEMTYYFDDWTLDYSSAVDDRNPPVISNATYCVSDTNIEIDGQTVDTNVLSFGANVADYAAANAEGLDYGSAKIYVDGVALDGVTASGTTMGVQDVVLSNGVHKIKFEIADKLGNSTTLTKTLTVDCQGASSAVRLSGHNDLGNTVEAGSVYYVDITADAIEDISCVTVTVDLQSAHEWELDHMIVAKGFEASYTLNKVKDNVATITITRTGTNTATGAVTLASLPVRVWSFDESTLIGGDSSAAPQTMTAAQRYASSYGEPVLLVKADAVYGKITYVNGKTGTFGSSIEVATAVTGNKTKAWHVHDAELTVLSKAPTCDEDGYGSRTYCETCGSVVDWGVTIRAAGHAYVLSGETFVCSECGDELELGTGLFKVNGIYYYAIAGNLISGWQNIDGVYHLFGADYSAVTGEHTIGGIRYRFGADGKLLSDVFVVTAKGIKCYYGPSNYVRGWQTIGGSRYYFDEEGYALTGYGVIKVNRNDPNSDTYAYLFDTDGKYIEDVTASGLITTGKGDVYYIENGKTVHAGLIEVDGYYYYISGTGKAATGKYNVTQWWTNGLLPAAEYLFGDDGKMIDPPFVVDENFTGLHDGYYYVDGEPYHAGLIMIDGYYYYINGTGKAVTGKYNVTQWWTNGLLPAAEYQFDSDGKMIDPPVSVDENFTGLHDGYYYVDGEPYHAGLIMIDGYYYYINGTGKAVTGTYNVTQWWTNGLLPAGEYQFDSDGRMIIE